MFKLNEYSWEVLCKSSLRREYVVQLKCVLMGRFMVCVGFIVCIGQGRDIFYLMTNTRMDRKRYKRAAG